MTGRNTHTYSFRYPLGIPQDRQSLSPAHRRALMSFEHAIDKWAPVLRCLPAECQRVFSGLIDRKIMISIQRGVETRDLQYAAFRMSYMKWTLGVHEGAKEVRKIRYQRLPSFLENKVLVCDMVHEAMSFDKPTKKQVQQLRLVLQASYDINTAYIRLLKRMGLPPQIFWNTPGSLPYMDRYILQRYVKVVATSPNVRTQTEEGHAARVAQRVKSLKRKARKMELRLSARASEIFDGLCQIERDIKPYDERLQAADDFLGHQMATGNIGYALSELRTFLGLLSKIRKMETGVRRPLVMTCAIQEKKL